MILLKRILLDEISYGIFYDTQPEYGVKEPDRPDPEISLVVVVSLIIVGIVTGITMFVKRKLPNKTKVDSSKEEK